MKKVAAVIVTNNRLNLLREAVHAVKTQPYALMAIVVVDNASIDGTREWLGEQEGLTVIEQANLGGSGGFYTGIKHAVAMGAEWLWVMDDDTIPNPETLPKLVDKIDKINEPIGFIGSKCVWTDGSPHLMNIPAITPSFNKNLPFNLYDTDNLLLIETCSFVSLLINTQSVKEVGLPYKDFFIWGDDQEYTRRITNAGYLGLYSIDSIVLHKTGINYFPDFYRDTPSNLWKHAYGFRNEFFMIKKNRGYVYFFAWLTIKLLYTSLKLIRIRKTDRRKFIAVILKSGWQSIFFNPTISYV